MQIRSNYSYLPSPEYRRDRAVDAPTPARGGGDSGERGGSAREVTRISRSPVARTADDDLANLPPQVRGALQSYLSNGPSLSERYGVELAGVDTFV